MAKSRTALLAIAPMMLGWPGAARAAPDPPPLTAEELLADYNARFLDQLRSVDGLRRCPRGAAGDDAIVVCGRNIGARMRLPLGSEPEEGARHRLVAGETPSGVGALSVGRACCGATQGLNVIGIAGALARGVGRILHPN